MSAWLALGVTEQWWTASRVRYAQDLMFPLIAACTSKSILLQKIEPAGDKIGHTEQNDFPAS